MNFDFRQNYGFSSPWELIQSERPEQEPESAVQPMFTVQDQRFQLKSLWLEQAGKVREARSAWFAVTAQRMIHWWCSWSARAHRDTSHVLSLCPTTSKPVRLSRMIPLGFQLTTRGKGKVLRNKIHWIVTWKRGAILKTISNCAVKQRVSIIVFLLETETG